MNKSRPILFSGPMVRALLAGTKTQTRRVVKCKHLDFVAGCEADRNDPCNYGYERDDGWVKLKASSAPRDDEIQVPCPYGQPGDQLWVRETIRLEDRIGLWARSLYVADGRPTVADAWPWKNNVLPSIHCPKGLSRIALEIINVRAERLNDISEEDAKEEGLSAITKDGSLFKYGIPDRDGLPGTDDDGWPWQQWECDPRNAYRALWESINGPGSWNVNPFVWVIEFKQVAP